MFGATALLLTLGCLVLPVITIEPTDSVTFYCCMNSCSTRASPLLPCSTSKYTGTHLEVRFQLKLGSDLISDKDCINQQQDPKVDISEGRVTFSAKFSPAHVQWRDLVSFDKQSDLYDKVLCQETLSTSDPPLHCVGNFDKLVNVEFHINYQSQSDSLSEWMQFGWFQTSPGVRSHQGNKSNVMSWLIDGVNVSLKASHDEQPRKSVKVFQDTFSERTLNTSLWLDISKQAMLIRNSPYCNSNVSALLFNNVNTVINDNEHQELISHLITIPISTSFTEKRSVGMKEQWKSFADVGATNKRLKRMSDNTTHCSCCLWWSQLVPLCNNSNPNYCRCCKLPDVYPNYCYDDDNSCVRNKMCCAHDVQWLLLSDCNTSPTPNPTTMMAMLNSKTTLKHLQMSINSTFLKTAVATPTSVVHQNSPSTVVSNVTTNTGTNTVKTFLNSSSRHMYTGMATVSTTPTPTPTPIVHQNSPAAIASNVTTNTGTSTVKTLNFLNSSSHHMYTAGMATVSMIATPTPTPIVHQNSSAAILTTNTSIVMTLLNSSSCNMYTGIPTVSIIPTPVPTLSVSPTTTQKSSVMVTVNVTSTPLTNCSVSKVGKTFNCGSNMTGDTSQQIFSDVTSLLEGVEQNSNEEDKASSASQLLDTLDRLAFQTFDDGSYKLGSIQLKLTTVNSTNLSQPIVGIEANGSSITLPTRIFQGKGTVRVASFYFQDLVLPGTLADGNNDTVLVSPVISAALMCGDGMCDSSSLSLPENNQVEIVLTNENKDPQLRPICVFWEIFQSQETGTISGRWNTSGCELNYAKSNDTTTCCECNHLTHFAILLSPAGLDEIDEYHVISLEIISYVGVTISLLALAVTAFIYIFFKVLWSMRNYIHVNLCLSLMASYLVFVVGVDKTSNEIGCMVVAVLLQYLFLVSFMWMLMEGVVLYVALVKVFLEGSTRKKYILLFTILSYGLPLLYMGFAIPFGLLLNGSRHYYQVTEDVIDACWLRYDTHFIWTFITPVILIILIDIGFFVMAVVILRRQRAKMIANESKLSSIMQWLKSAISLVIVMGLTWIVGVLMFHKSLLPFAYIFTIVVAFQGLAIFVILVPLSKQVRQAVLRWTRDRVSESTFLSAHFGSKLDTLMARSLKNTNSAQQKSQKNGKKGFAQSYELGTFEPPSRTHVEVYCNIECSLKEEQDTTKE